MTYPEYAEYKDSGVDWIGPVPSHWIVPKLKYLATIRNGRDYKEIESENGEYPVIGSGGEFSRASDYLYCGESVLLGRKGTVDTPIYIDGCFWTVDTMFYTELFCRTHGRFLYYYAKTFPFGRYSTNTALPSMAQEDLANLYVGVPEYSEQKEIANFLDHETARIDALIEEQQRLIELLQEKRQAVISHAVTKGLDPDVPMKDSGVEWLGEIPEHWEVVKVSHILSESPRNGVSPELTEEERGIATFSIAAVRENTVNVSKHLKYANILYGEAKRYLLTEGDILIVRGNGNIKMVGKAGVVENLPDADAIYPDILIRVRPAINKITPYYFVYAINSFAGRVQIENCARTSNGTYKVTSEDVKNLKIPIPSESEQRDIVKGLAEQLTRLDSLVESSDRVISLL